MTKDRQTTGFMQTPDSPAADYQVDNGVGFSAEGGNSAPVPYVLGAPLLGELVFGVFAEAAGDAHGAEDVLGNVRDASLGTTVNGAATVSGVKAERNGTVGSKIENRKARGNSVCVAVTHDSLRDATSAELNQCAEVIANPEVELAKRAACAGATPGETLDLPHAKAALSLIARSARDVFGTIKAASAYFEDDNFDNTGMTAEALVAGGRGTAVIARLDELRYGPQG